MNRLLDKPGLIGTVFIENIFYGMLGNPDADRSIDAKIPAFTALLWRERAEIRTITAIFPLFVASASLSQQKSQLLPVAGVGRFTSHHLS